MQVTSSWPASWQSGSTCFGTGPRLSNNPTLDNGSNSLYTLTNKRFTEVKVKDRITQQIVDSKLWTGTTGAAGLEVQVTAPQSNAYDIIFEQYDGCSSSCFLIGGRQVRLIWTDTKTFYSYTGMAYMTPQYNKPGSSLGSYSICN